MQLIGFINICVAWRLLLTGNMRWAIIAVYAIIHFSRRAVTRIQSLDRGGMLGVRTSSSRL